MLELGILKTFDSETYKAGVQLADSLTTYLDDISVSISIASSAMVVGNYLLVAIPGGNPRDACVVASWPAGSSGGGGGGVTDHGELTGLGDDDHSQYLNTARHDLTARHPLGTVVPHESALNNLGDVNVPSPDDLDLLQYDADASKWTPRRGFTFGPDMRWWDHEMQFYNWTTTLTGSASIEEQGYGILGFKTGTTPGSTARGRGFRFGWFHYGVYCFDWVLSIQPFTTSANSKIWYMLMHDAAADPGYRSIGFRLDNLNLKGIVHDGSSLHVIDLMTLQANTGYTISLKFRLNDKIEWFVNGVKYGESTNIPTATDQAANYCVFAMTNGADSTDVFARLWWHAWILDRGIYG